MSKRKALIVGIDRYSQNPLQGCVHDATEMNSALKRNDDSQVNFHTELLTSSDTDIRRADLRNKIEENFSGKGEVALFYFAGHGTISDSKGYLVTPDSEMDQDGVSMDDVLRFANKSEFNDRIVILDCCHSGAAGNPAIGDGQTSQLADGVTILSASRSSESANEGAQGGIFTALVTEALNGGASDLAGNVTAGMIFAYVDAALGAHEQRPIFKTNIERFTPLRETRRPIGLDTLHALTTLFPTPDHEFALTPEYEFTEDSSVGEKEKVFRTLQKLRGVNLVIPYSGSDVPDEERGHMYFAAIRSRSCHLTALGKHYWNLVDKDLL